MRLGVPRSAITQMGCGQFPKPAPPAGFRLSSPVSLPHHPGPKAIFQRIEPTEQQSLSRPSGQAAGTCKARSDYELRLLIPDHSLLIAVPSLRPHPTPHKTQKQCTFCGPLWEAWKSGGVCRFEVEPLRASAKRNSYADCNSGFPAPTRGCRQTRRWSRPQGFILGETAREVSVTAVVP
jgi:hypothetical protein